MWWFKKIFFAFTKRERITFILAGTAAVISFVAVLGILFVQFTKAVPTAGGEYTEGAVGQPERVNPVTASSATDAALVRMVYSNLYDIADAVTASPDMRVWTVRLKEGLLWQDGEKLTSDDVIFTVRDGIENPDTNSPLFQSWQGVAVSRVSELELQFNLVNPYAFFADNLRGLYILPKHLFAGTPGGNWKLSDYNLKPVGSGPYRFVSYEKDRNGFVTSYHLEAWSGYKGTKPLIQSFIFRFFNDEGTLVDNFNAGQVDGFGNVSPQNLAAVKRPHDLFAWRTSAYYAVFFNQSKNLALQDPAVRKALGLAIDRKALIADALAGNGTPENGPIPDGMPYFSETSATSTPNATSSDSSPEAILDAAGWKVGTDGLRAKKIQQSSIPLSITITVPQVDFLEKSAQFVQNAWQAIGAHVDITTEPSGDIVSNAITTRDYEALIFGNVLGPSSDLYSFWHSSERFYPGLNLSIYNNPKLDSLIQSARQNTNDASRAKQFADAQALIVQDHPAAFLYSTDYVYVANKNVQGISTDKLLVDPADRFRDLANWYLNTARVLK